MASTRNRAPRDPIIRWACTFATIFMVVFCGFLSNCPNLHQIIHPDANDGHHECAITMFAHGQVDLTDGGWVLAVPVRREIQAAVLFEGLVPVGGDYLLLPGRAPPVLAS